MEKIGGKLDEIALNLSHEGYDPKCSEVVLDIDGEEKAFVLLHHSEKLAAHLALYKSAHEPLLG